MADPDDAAGAGDDEEGAGAGRAPEPGEDETPRIVILDPELTDEAREELASALGCAVLVLSPAELGPDFPSAADRAIVVPFRLPAQCGLDVVETLRLREHGREVPIAVADDEPTRSRVLAALRVGATSFALRPYDAEELRLRLGDALKSTEPEEVSPDVSQ